ncbi:hypothetical protein VPH35_072194 [Triticum aestivum]
MHYRLFTKENCFRRRVEDLKINVANQDDDLHNSWETRPTLCACMIDDHRYVYFAQRSYSSVLLHACTFYHPFLLFNSLYGHHRCYYRDVSVFFMRCCKYNYLCTDTYVFFSFNYLFSGLEEN